LDEGIKTGNITGSLPKFVSADALNVIPETCELGGTLRGFDNDILAGMINSMEKVAKEICDEAGEGISLVTNNKISFRALVNDEGPVQW